MSDPTIKAQFIEALNALRAEFAALAPKQVSEEGLEQLLVLDGRVQGLATSLGIPQPDLSGLPGGQIFLGWTRMPYIWGNGHRLLFPGRWQREMERLLAVADALPDVPTSPADAKEANRVEGTRERGPRWDETTRTLLLDGIGIKTFRKHPAECQIELLEAVQKAEWAQGVVVRFKGSTTLRQVVQDLNRTLPKHSIRFRLDGTGEGVCWERSG